MNCHADLGWLRLDVFVGMVVVEGDGAPGLVSFSVAVAPSFEGEAGALGVWDVVSDIVCGWL